MRALAKRILVADDDAILISMMKFNLEKKGYTLIAARDGEEALKKARRLKPDLVILDVMMPKLDGDQVAAMLKSGPATKHIPIFMLTNLIPERGARSAAMENAFCKPVDFEKLFSQIKRVLGE